MKQKLITSHRSRVKRAKMHVENSPEHISIFDREALVEFYLLEDVVRLCEWRMKKENEKIVTTRGGEMSHKLHLEQLTAIINIFKTIIEIAESEIIAGNYKAVWSSIPESALMKAAGKVQYLPQLRALATKMLRSLSSEAITATAEGEALNDDIDAIEAHDKNVRKVKGLPSSTEIDELIRAVEIAIPDKIICNNIRPDSRLS